MTACCVTAPSAFSPLSLWGFVLWWLFLSNTKLFMFFLSTGLVSLFTCKRKNTLLLRSCVYDLSATKMSKWMQTRLFTWRLDKVPSQYHKITWERLLLKRHVYMLQWYQLYQNRREFLQDSFISPSVRVWLTDGSSNLLPSPSLKTPALFQPASNDDFSDCSV